MLLYCYCWAVNDLCLYRLYIVRYSINKWENMTLTSIARVHPKSQSAENLLLTPQALLPGMNLPWILNQVCTLLNGTWHSSVLDGWSFVQFPLSYSPWSCYPWGTCGWKVESHFQAVFSLTLLTITIIQTFGIWYSLWHSNTCIHPWLKKKTISRCASAVLEMTCSKNSLNILLKIEEFIQDI